MENQDLIKLYETVADLMQQMVAAARKGEWEHLTFLESRCAAQVEIIRQKDVTRQALPPQTRERKARLLETILENDRQIRDITEPWMTQLSALMNNAGTENRLARTYGRTSEY